jgi:hypothetical protein
VGQALDLTLAFLTRAKLSTILTEKEIHNNPALIQQ